MSSAAELFERICWQSFDIHGLQAEKFPQQGLILKRLAFGESLLELSPTLGGTGPCQRASLASDGSLRLNVTFVLMRRIQLLGDLGRPQLGNLHFCGESRQSTYAGFSRHEKTGTAQALPLSSSLRKLVLKLPGLHYENGGVLAKPRSRHPVASLPFPRRCFRRPRKRLRLLGLLAPELQG